LKKRGLFRLLTVLSCLASLSTPAWAGEPNFDRGVELYKKGKYKEALPFFQKAILANRTSPTPYYYRAVCLQQMGNTTAALALYGQIQQSFPTSQEARLAATVLNRSASAAVAAASASAAAGSSLSSATIAAAAIPQASANLTTFDAANATEEELSRLPDETKVPFTRTTGGHIWVNVWVNKRPMQVMFDTGASTCLFGLNQLQAAGISPQLTDQKLAIGGVGSHAETARAAIMDIQLGDIDRHMPVMVCDHASAPPLLGETFFNGYRYDIDNQGGFIHFMKKSGSHTRFAEAMDTMDVPFQQVGNNMVVEAKINGNPCPMFFDTGAFGVCLSYMAAISCGLHIPSDATPKMTGGVGGASMGYEFEVDRLELGPIVKTHIPIIVMMHGGPPLPLLGQSFFKDRRYTIDNDKHVIKFVH
jgi:clan AA aspartic protease (TIGR02281 family)